MFYRLRCALARFMAGRYGTDSLNRTLFIVYFILWLVGFLVSGVAGFVLYWLSLAVALWIVYRSLSRDIPRRQAENDRFLRLTARLRDIRRCRYRRCPACDAHLRLPIKHGRRTVTCGRCHTQFKTFFL